MLFDIGLHNSVILGYWTHTPVGSVTINSRKVDTVDKTAKRKDKSGRCVRFITLHKPTLRALRLMETPLCDWP